MNTFSVTLIQSSLFWENPVANLAMFEEKIWQISEKTDLIILPEMFTTGFSMNTIQLAEPMNLTTFKWMKQQASQTGAVITGSFIVKENGKFLNRLLWMQPDGNFGYYDKKYLFSPSGEKEYYTAGNQKLLITYKNWKFCPLICYDLRFPEWSRNKFIPSSENESIYESDYDCLIYVASWPEARHLAWHTLLRARAIENQSYCIGVNRIGTDGNGLIYKGGSAIADFTGNDIFKAGNAEITQTFILDKSTLKDFRQKHPFYLDQ